MQEPNIRGLSPRARVLGFLLLVVATARCGKPGPAQSAPGEIVLRVGVARFGAASAITGLRPIVQNLSVEGLTRIAENGRAEARIAKGWTVAADRRSMNLELRAGVKFHDGSDATAELVAQILQTALPPFMGAAFDDIERITATASNGIEIRFRQPSPFPEEALEVALRKPGHPTVGTGPFATITPGSLTALRGNRDYYLGSPTIDRVLVSNYPTVRAAWADLLRDKVDMLYEVSVDALDLMQGSTNASVFTFTRPYQYLVFLNPRSPKLRSASVRQALNLAIDRVSLVREAFNGHALPSSGPTWPRHWSFQQQSPTLPYDPVSAAALLSSVSAKTGNRGTQLPLRFTCLVPPDYERIALVIKRQLEEIGVEMDLKEASVDEATAALQTQTFDAVLLDTIGGPSFFRTYFVWHSGGGLQGVGFPAMDTVLDRARHATSDEEYRKAIAAFQQLALEDPPAIFLAWGERARAVSNKFRVPVEPGRDILTTLRLWRPAADERFANRN